MDNIPIVETATDAQLRDWIVNQHHNWYSAYNELILKRHHDLILKAGVKYELISPEFSRSYLESSLFIRLHEHDWLQLRKWNYEKPFRHWLKTQLLYLIRTEARIKRRSNSATSPALSIDSLLQTLSEEDRKLLNLKYTDGLSATEIAANLNISRYEVTTRIRQALTFIRKRYEFKSNTDMFGIKLLINRGTATPNEIAELLFEISKLYRIVGGSGITFSPINIKESVVT